MPKTVIYCCAAALVLALAPWPYGYYRFLRIAATAVFCWAAALTYDRKTYLLFTSFAALAILFNPVFPIALKREVWQPIDIGAAIFLLLMRKTILPDSGKA